MLEGASGDAAAGASGQRRKRAREIGQGDAPPSPEQRVTEIADSPPQPCRERDRQGTDRKGEEPNDYAALRRRSRRTSITIGITERTMTTTTTTWM